MDNPSIDPARLAELRAVLGKLDPGSKKSWILEIYATKNGQNVLSQEINIKTGRVKSHKRQAEAEK